MSLTFASCEKSNDDTPSNNTEWKVATSSKGRIIYKNSKGEYYYYKNSTRISIKEWECGTHNGKILYTGPRGGCYYKNSNGNKTYVDRSECNCN